MSGVSAASGESPEVITLKYDSKGNQLWETSYFVGRDGYGGYLLRVDAQHNVYITCLVYSKESLDWIVIKYDSNGNQLWANRYNSPTNLHDIPMDLELDRDGNVYVTGHSDNEGNSNCITIKYDSDGSQLWSASRSYDFGYCIAISVDDSGNSYVTSNIGDGYANFGTIKYDPNGNQLWTVSYKNDYCYGDSYAKDNTLDNLGNLYVIGNSCNDYTTIKP